MAEIQASKFSSLRHVDWNPSIGVGRAEGIACAGREQGAKCDIALEVWWLSKGIGLDEEGLP